MRQRIVHIAIWCLTILVFPLGIKTSHALSSHHVHLTNNESTITEIEEHCTICDFEYAHFIFGYNVELTQSPEVYGEMVLLFIGINMSSFSGSDSPLRGPPSIPS